MADDQQNIRTLFSNAQALLKHLEALQSNSDVYQESLRQAISQFEECGKLADAVHMFSSNEIEEDISSGDLQYLSIDYYLGELFPKAVSGDRRIVLRSSQEAYERFLNRLDAYAMLAPSDKKLFENYLEDHDEFALLPSSDPSTRRQTKISRFKQERDLRHKLELLSNHSTVLRNDDDALRDLYKAEIALHIHQAFHSLDLVAQEVKMLKLAPAAEPRDHLQLQHDSRARAGHRTDAYSEKLDSSLASRSANGGSGPILSKDGRPLRPFRLLTSRQNVQDGVFRPDHNLPSMTIDEYLEEEKRRGGIIEGGGAQSGIVPEIDEDDMNAQDRETMKARDWDEFKEDNPRGNGNTLNRG